MRLAGLDRATAQLAGFEVAGKSAEASLLGMSRGTALVVGGLGLLGTAIAVQGVRKFASFDEAMTQSLAIMGDVSDTMENEMTTAARDMARETIFSADQAAESYFFLASAGLDAEQSVAALPQVAKFAQAGMFDMAQATELLTDAQSALGLSSDNTTENLLQMKRVSDVLVKANTLANATVEQFAESLTNRAAPRLRQMNKTVEEGTAALAVFADQGIKGRRAGTLLDMTLRELSRRARENEEAFKRANIEVFDSQGNMNNLADIVEDLENRLGGLSVKQRSAELSMLGFQQRSIRGILALIGMSDELRNYEREMARAGNTTGDVADNQMDTLIKQAGILGSEIKDVFIETGEVMGPGLQNILEDTIDFMRLTRDMIAEIPELIDRVNEITGEPDFLEGQEGFQFQPGNVQAITSATRGLQRYKEEQGLALEETDKWFDSLSKIHELSAVDFSGPDFDFDFASDELKRFGQEIESVVESADRVLSLAEARIEAEENVVDLTASLQARLDDVNDKLDERHRLNEEQETSLLNQRTALREMREEIDRLPLTRQLDRVLEQSRNLVGLTEARMEANILNLNTVSGMVSARDEILTILNNEHLTYQEQISAINTLIRLRQTLSEAGPVQEVAQPAMQTPGRVEDVITDANIDDITAKPQGKIEADWEAFGKTFSQDMARIGGNLLMSLGRGAKDTEEALKDMFFQILNSLIQTAVQVFLIASPSRVMRDIGRQVTLGLAEGLTSESKRVQSAWTGVLNNIERPGIMMGSQIGAGMISGPAGAQQAKLALQGISPSVEVNVDTSGIPEPKTPFDISRDAEWQKALRESIDVARKDGFR